MENERLSQDKSIGVLKVEKMLKNVQIPGILKSTNTVFFELIEIQNNEILRIFSYIDS